MTNRISRRNLVATGLGFSLLGASPTLGGCRSQHLPEPASSYKISLAQWSLHRAFLGRGFFGRLNQRAESRADRATVLKNDLQSFMMGELDPLDFALVARRDFGIEAIEYVNTFYLDKADSRSYWNEIKNRADNEGVKSLLIMCNFEGELGDPDRQRRLTSVENHLKWVEIAKFLGCHSIRVNARSSGSAEEQHDFAADGLGRLADLAAQDGLNVLVENHGGISSNAQWLASLIKSLNRSNVGTLPDFGNFKLEDGSFYDPYQGVRELMPYAKAVSAKSYDFDANGNETQLDYGRLLEIVLDHRFDGYIGIEYEGNQLSENEGIIATRDLLVRTREQLST